MNRKIEAESQETPEPSIQHAFAFRDKYFQRHQDRKFDRRLDRFFDDLTDGRFWGVIGRIDGETDRVYHQSKPLVFVSDEEIAQETKETRQWANENFTPRELQEIFNIYLDQALHAPVGRVGGNTPGSYRGHSLAYEQVVENSRNMFSDRITPELRRQLINGRFWEEIPDAQAGINSRYSLNALEDILTNHTHELDPDFAPEGFKLLERNERKLSNSKHADLHLLSDTALDNYLDFVRKINDRRDNSGVSRTQVSGLMLRYVDALLEVHWWDHEVFRFERHYDPDIDDMVTPEKTTLPRFEDPLVQQCLSAPEIRERLAERFHNILEYGNESEKEMVAQVVARMPEQADMIESIALLMMKKLHAIRELRSKVREIQREKVESKV